MKTIIAFILSLSYASLAFAGAVQGLMITPCAGGGCSCTVETQSTAIDGGGNKITESWTLFYQGTVIDKVGGHTNICRIDWLPTTEFGDVDEEVFYMHKWTMTGNDLNSSTELATFDGDELTSDSWHTVTFSPYVSIAQGEAFTISMSAVDSTNYILWDITALGSTTADWDGFNQWNGSKVRQQHDAAKELALKIYTCN